MPNFTTNLNLKKPLQNENYNVDDFNGNMDIIDSEIQSKQSKIINDDTLPKKYTIGINNGLLYYKEVL